MAGNQREMRKKELKAKKDRKNKTIIWIIIAIVVAVLIMNESVFARIMFAILWNISCNDTATNA